MRSEVSGEEEGWLCRGCGSLLCQPCAAEMRSGQPVSGSGLGSRGAGVGVRL